MIEGKLLKALRELEEQGDLVLATTDDRVITKHITQSIGLDISELFTSEECAAIGNCLNAVIHGTKIDDSDRQTIIGMDKAELERLHTKLATSHPR